MPLNMPMPMPPGPPGAPALAAPAHTPGSATDADGAGPAGRPPAAHGRGNLPPGAMRFADGSVLIPPDIAGQLFGQTSGPAGDLMANQAGGPPPFAQGRMPGQPSPMPGGPAERLMAGMPMTGGPPPPPPRPQVTVPGGASAGPQGVRAAPCPVSAPDPAGLPQVADRHRSIACACAAKEAIEMPFVSREQQRAICRKKDAKSQRACKEFAAKTDFAKLPDKAPKNGTKG